MECPYCHKENNEVINSRPTRKKSQIWRRRKCLACGEIFTTQEIVDMSHLVVIKKSGKPEVFHSIKLFAGIYGATIGSKTANREIVVEKISHEVEREIMFLKKKRISTGEIADIVLRKLKNAQTATFMRFLAYTKNIASEAQMKREMNKYAGDIH